jgi:DNA-binding transcriptional MerR regulator
MTAALSIQQAAAACGLTVHTLRYYERIGLIRPVPRRGNGHRRYRAEDMGWIAFLLRLRATGMTVEEMQRYARLRDAGEELASVAERKRMLEAHADRIAAEVAALSETLDYLRHKISLYDDMELRLKGAGNAERTERQGNEGRTDALRAGLGAAERS